MKDQRIAEGNRNIALFDGWRFVDISTDEYENGYYEYVHEHGRTIITPDNLHYHDDWSMLMPVVEKIESLGHQSDISYWEVEYNGYEYLCSFYRDQQEESVAHGNSKDSKIRAVYEAVTSFILWYNQTTNPDKK